MESAMNVVRPPLKTAGPIVMSDVVARSELVPSIKLNLALTNLKIFYYTFSDYEGVPHVRRVVDGESDG